MLSRSKILELDFRKMAEGGEFSLNKNGDDGGADEKKSSTDKGSGINKADNEVFSQEMMESENTMKEQIDFKNEESINLIELEIDENFDYYYNPQDGSNYEEFDIDRNAEKAVLNVNNEDEEMFYILNQDDYYKEEVLNEDEFLQMIIFEEMIQEQIAPPG